MISPSECFVGIRIHMELPLKDVFNFCPRCGKPNSSRGSVPFRCDCGFSYFFTPISAVGAIILDAQNQILMIRRAKDPGKGMLGMPGGFIDIEESAESALDREVLEEVGLDVIHKEFLATYPNKYTYNEVTVDVLDVYYVCQVKSFDSIQIQDEEVLDYCFYQLEELDLDELAFEANRNAIKKYISNQSN